MRIHKLNEHRRSNNDLYSARCVNCGVRDEVVVKITCEMPVSFDGDEAVWNWDLAEARDDLRYAYRCHACGTVWVGAVTKAEDVVKK